jgi:branched-chain amino acid transport system ATP-binding protein
MPTLAPAVRRRFSVLEIENLHSAYGRIEVLKGVSLRVGAGEVVALIGSNGAGKTTLMRALSGVQPITGGSIIFLGERIERLPSHARVRRGIVQSPEGRHVFAPLSVEDNLHLGGYLRRDNEIEQDRARVYAMFPVLHEKRHLLAGGLSGGQQQMLAIGRALMGKPKLLLLDEPSLGLAPLLVDQILAAIAALRTDGVTILLVEQNASAALEIADRGYVIETGRIAFADNAAALLCDPRVKDAYLGLE